MDTKIIVLVNQKGGCGKTTIVMQLAGALGREGKKVLIVDADPQGTATGWAKSADDKNPFPATISGLSSMGDKVHREVKRHIGQYDFIFVDCPPAVDSPVPQSALMIADVALVPVIPSPADLLATNGIQALISRMQDVNESMKAYVVPNMVTSTKIAKKTIELLQRFGMKITAAGLSYRTAFRESTYIGGTVFDLKNEGADKAQAEVTALKNELLKIMKSAA